MKRIYIILTIALACCMAATAQNSPGMAHHTNGGNRYDQIGTVSIPVLDYKVINGEKTIFVSGTIGMCTLYITEYGNDNSVLFGPVTVNGEDDEVVINLEDDTYTICLTTSIGCTYRYKLNMLSSDPISGGSATITPHNGTNAATQSIWSHIFDY